MREQTQKIFRMKKALLTRLILLVAALLIIISPLAANAAVEANLQVLAAGQTISGLGFFAGQLVEIDGTVDGTTFASGQEVHINGVINGDLFAAAQVVTINGKVNGNIYAAGQDLRIGTQCSGDVFLAGQRIELMPAAVMGRDLFTAGYRIMQNGVVQRQFSGAASDISIRGSIGQDANLAAEKVQILDGSLIKGNLIYESANKASIAPGAKITGQTDWQIAKPAAKPTVKPEKNKFSGSIWEIMLSIASALLIWFLIKIWRPDFWQNQGRFIGEQPLKALGMGVLAFLLMPLLVILLMITIIGIPFAVILGLAYGITLYLAKIFVAVYIGAWLTERFGWTERHKGVWPVLLGLTILVLLSKVPFIGSIIGILVVLVSLGSLVLANYKSSAKSEISQI